MARPEADDFEDDGMSVAERQRRRARRIARVEAYQRFAGRFAGAWGGAFCVMMAMGLSHAADEAAAILMRGLLISAVVVAAASVFFIPPAPTDDEKQAQREENQRSARRAGGFCITAMLGYFALLSAAFFGDVLFGSAGRELTPILLPWGLTCIPLGIAAGIFAAMAGDPADRDRWPFTSRHMIRRITRR